MKKTLVIILIIVVLLIAVTTAFVFLRGSDSGDDIGDQPSDIKGYVLEMDEDSMLVAEGLSGDDPYEGDIERLEGNAITYQISEDTEILDSSGEEIELSDIELYDEVEVWSTGVIMESYPAQADALRIETTGESFQPGESDDNDPVSCDWNNSSRMNVINTLEDNWSDIEVNIPERPSAGSTSWYTPYHVQFIGNETIMAAFEDGHSVMTAVIQFECENGELTEEFSILDSVANFPLEEETWSDLYRSYGTRSHSVNTYTSIDVYVEGNMIEADDWKEIEPNIFILDTGSGHKL